MMSMYCSYLKMVDLSLLRKPTHDAHSQCSCGPFGAVNHLLGGTGKPPGGVQRQSPGSFSYFKSFKT